MNGNEIWTIVDTAEGSDGNQRLVLWNEHADHDSPHLSLPSIIRYDRDHCRSAILDALDKFATFEIGGRPLHRELEIESGLSYLPMTLVWAKRWGELGSLTDAVKLLVLTERLRAKPPSRINIHIGDARVASALAETCTRLGIPCNQQPRWRMPRWQTLRALRHLLRWLTFATRSPSTTNFVIADYLFRVDLEALAQGNYRSGYWSFLPEMIERAGTTITWLHRFTPHPALPTPAKARRVLRGLPQHHLLDQVHGLGDAWRAYQLYRRIKGLEPDARSAFIVDDCDLWPLFARDWYESFHGSHPMSVAINMTNLRRLLPPSKARTLLYIHENQPWEFALRHQVEPDANAIAVVHATVRFWDLRFFVGPASRDRLPRLIAVNSDTAREELMRGGHNAHALRDVEALMYHQPDESGSPSSARAGILVLGELEVASTQRYLDWVLDCAGDTPVTFKPHPLIDLRSFSFDPNRVEVVTSSIDGLLRSSRVVVLGASGTATLEAISHGLPVVTVLNPRELDLSAVSGHSLLRTVATKDELARALDDALAMLPMAKVEPVFFDDPQLSRWKTLLNLS